MMMMDEEGRRTRLASAGRANTSHHTLAVYGNTSTNVVDVCACP
jgi:hypothetical protein